MKTIIHIICTFNLLVLSINGTSQFTFGTGNLYGFNVSTVQKIGIGNFTANTDVLAKLHVNHFRLNTNAPTNGILFRTDGDQGMENRWQLFTGTSATAQTERFRIRTLANGFDTWIERTQVGSEADIRLLTAQIEVRARLKRLGDFCELNGEALSDIVQFGDGTNVNIFNHNANNRGTSFWGTSGTVRSGNFYNIHAPGNVQVDAIAADGTGSTLQNGDVYFQGRLATDTLTYVRLQNGSVVNNNSVPALMGYNHSNNFHGLAISGRINPTNDISNIAIPAVVEVDGRMGALNDANTPVVNRLLYRLCNFNIPVMTVEAGGQTGINTDTPDNRLEIKSKAGDPYFNSTNGSSGLRLKNMTSTAAPVANPGSGVLTVDANGDVIYTNTGLDDCRWVTFPFGIGTGFNSTPCNTKNVGIGKVPDVKVTLDVKATTNSIQQAIRAENLFSGGIAGEFTGHSYGLICDATNSGSPGILCYGDGVSTGGFWVPSDENLKTNITDFSQGLDIITQLNPKSYDFRVGEFPGLDLSAEPQIGLMAQDVAQVIPSAVKSFILPAQSSDDSSESTNYEVDLINYERLIPIMIGAIKEQQSQINSLKEQLNACCSSVDTRSTPASADHSQQVTLRDQRGIILNQNVPNPFAEQTTITHRIDEPFQKAQILFYDGSGKLIQTADITTTGSGSITVFADDLSSGTYSYALVVDGKLVDTKRMVKR